VLGLAIYSRTKLSLLTEVNGRQISTIAYSVLNSVNFSHRPTCKFGSSSVAEPVEK